MTKRILAALTALVLIAALPLGALANVKTRYVYTANGKSLNMRSAPIAHANNKIQSVPYGAQVLLESYVNGGTWAYVSYNNKAGYVMTRYLTDVQPQNVQPAPEEESHEVSYEGFEPASYNVLVRAATPGSYVNLRWGPDKITPVHQRVNDGTMLCVIAQNKHWAQVQDPSTGAVGFMMRAFLTEAEIFAYTK